MPKSIYLSFIFAIAIISAFHFKQENPHHAFEEWKDKFGTPFQKSEQFYRKLVFEKNLKNIESHNSDNTQSYKKGVNQFSIYSDEQFKLRYLMDIQESKLLINQVDSIKNLQKSVSNLHKNESGVIDWTAQGKVSQVKNQGQCGSCWAFSTTGALESYALFYNMQVSLSQQQLVDCSTKYGNNGCSGGYPYLAFKYVYENGLSSQGEYPYAGRNQQCSKNGGTFRITNVYNLGGCSSLAQGIAAQPLSVTVDATNWAQYHSGVFGNCAASINHCVLMVGIDASGNWKIKNSWGTSWGQSGFIRLSPGNTCGLCNYAGIYPR